MSTQLMRKPSGEWIVLGDTDEELDRGIAAVERNLSGKPQRTIIDGESPKVPIAAAMQASKRGRPKRDGVDPKAQRRVGMIQGTLKFLLAINAAKDHRISSETVQELMGIEQPRAVGSVATIANRCIESVGLEPAAVYESVKTRDGRFWQGKSKLPDAIKALGAAEAASII